MKITMFTTTIHNMQKNYSPLYFLSALGAGGLSVSFFMYLLFMTSHKGLPIPTFNTLFASFQSGDVFLQSMIIISAVMIILFAVFHIFLLAANVKAYNHFKTTNNYQTLKSTNAEVQLMAAPLTFAMTINVLFIIGAVFVPNLWSVVEYLFPLAILAFGVIGFIALKIFLEYASRLFTQGGFDHSQNNNLSQMLAMFAFAMVGVGFSASAAMSHTQTTSLIAMILAIFFLTIVVIFTIVKLILGMYHMVAQGVDKTTSVSLWIVIPITTLLGIAIYRLDMAMAHNFSHSAEHPSHLLFFTTIISIQLLFGILGYLIMKKNNYFKDFIGGENKNPGSYALICPGVALTVMAFFFIHKVLIASGVMVLFSPAYFVILVPVLYLQFITIVTLFKLNTKMMFVK